MTTFEIFLAIVIAIASLLQVAAFFLIFATLRKLAMRVQDVIDTVLPVLRDLSESTQSIRTSVEGAASEVRATMAGIRTTSDEVRGIVTTEGREVRRMLGRASDVIEAQVEAISRDLDRARARIETVTSGLDRAVLDPARQITAAMVGVRKALEFFIARKRLKQADAGPNEEYVGSP